MPLLYIGPNEGITGPEPVDTPWLAMWLLIALFLLSPVVNLGLRLVERGLASARHSLAPSVRFVSLMSPVVGRSRGVY